MKLRKAVRYAQPLQRPTKTEIGPRNPDFRSSLNSRHSPTRRSRPKSANSRPASSPRIAVLMPGIIQGGDIRFRRLNCFEEIPNPGEALVINKALATVLACTAYLASNAVDAAEIKILCASGMREVVSEVQPRLARIAGQQVSISFDEAGELRKRLQGGEIADIAILPESFSMRWRRMATSSRRRLSTSRKALSASACATGTSARRSGSTQCSQGDCGREIPPPAGSPFMSLTSSSSSALWTNWRRSSGSRAINGTQRSSRRAKPDVAVEALRDQDRSRDRIHCVSADSNRRRLFSAALGSKAKEANVARTILQPSPVRRRRPSKRRAWIALQVESATSASGHQRQSARIGPFTPRQRTCGATGQSVRKVPEADIRMICRHSLNKGLREVLEHLAHQGEKPQSERLRPF